MVFRQRLVGKRSWRDFANLIFLGTLLAYVPPAAAHHSYPPLLTEDGEEVIRVFDASIELFRLLNPHSAMIINVTNDSGVPEDWLCLLYTSDAADE